MSSSSTSSSDAAAARDGTVSLSSHERTPAAGWPRAALVSVIAIVLLEVASFGQRQWFADMASWQWESKRHLLDHGELPGEVAIFGSSVLFHGLDPGPANAGAHGRVRVVNLALNGMALPQQAQLVRERLSASKDTRAVVLELRQSSVSPSSWTVGPYFRHWAAVSQLAQSGFHYWNPALIVPFVSNRVLPTFRYREGLDNWLSTALRTRSFPADTHERNRAVASEMRVNAGFSAGIFDRQVAPPSAVVERQWRPTWATRYWLQRLADDVAAADVRLVLLVTPTPEDRSSPTFDADVAATVAAMTAGRPTLTVDTFVPRGYPLDEFADDVHLNARGRAHLSSHFASWLQSRLP